MLVALVNAVKVESVPLNFNFFLRGVWTMGRDAHCPRRRIGSQPHAPPPRGRAGTGATGPSGQLSRFQPPGRTGPNHRRGRRRLHVRAARCPRRTDGVARVRAGRREWSSRGGHAALPRRGDPRTAPGARGARHRSARHRAVRHRWHGRTRRRRALGCARHPGLAEHGGMGHVSRGHGRSAGADARQPRLPGIPRRPSTTGWHKRARRCASSG